MSAEYRNATKGPPEPPAKRNRPEIIDMLVLVSVLTTVVILVVVGHSPAAVIAAAGGFVLSITQVWLRRHR